jgi:hypothetical protein
LLYSCGQEQNKKKEEEKECMHGSSIFKHFTINVKRNYEQMELFNSTFFPLLYLKTVLRSGLEMEGWKMKDPVGNELFVNRL